MFVASKDLSEELFKLSGWKDTHYIYYANGGQVTENDHCKNMVFDKPDNLPAYDLGYILRKLPGVPEIKKRAGNTWEAVCRIGEIVDGKIEDKTTWVKAKLPEDALTKLAIELFKQGILKAKE